MSKWLPFLLCLIVGSASAQQIDGQTGNVVYTTVNPAPPGVSTNWNGFIVSNTNGGGFSGGNVPAYNPNTGTFIFGYTQRTVNYSIAVSAINFALASSGSNVQVNGFRYSWEYLNQDFSRGTLTGNISLTNSSGQTVQSFGYNMPRTTNGWTTMSGLQNFNTQYAVPNLGNLNVSFTGKDDRFWAGYYGPQIRDIDVKMLYSIPVSFSSWTNLVGENGTFTLSKPGIVRYGAQGTYIYKSYEAGTYECSNGAWGQDPLGGVYKSCALGTNSPPPSSTPTTTAPTAPTAPTTPSPTTAAITEITTAAAQPVSEPTTTTNTSTTTTNTISDPVATSTSSPISLSSSSTSPSTSTSSTSQTSSTSSTTSTATSTAVSSSPSSSSREVNSSGTSIGLSVVARNQQREQTLALQVAQNAVAAAEQTAQQAQQEAVSVAQTSAASSVVNASSPVARQLTLSNRTEQASVAITSQSQAGLAASMSGPNTATVRNDTRSSALLSTQEIAATSSSFLPQTFTNQIAAESTSNQNSSTFSLLPPSNPQSTQTQATSVFTQENKDSIFKFALQTQSQSSFNSNEVALADNQKFLTDRTNPINAIINERPLEQSNQQSQARASVNTNVANNEIAGGVDLTRMAVAPAGYNQYLNLVIADAAFYAPKEVYRNQRNVDNVRVLRSLSSDRLHQEMVDQQYRK